MSDSRRVQPGDLFVAVRGGVAYIDQARAAGAAATLVPHDDHVAMADLGAADAQLGYRMGPHGSGRVVLFSMSKEKG